MTEMESTPSRRGRDRGDLDPARLPVFTCEVRDERQSPIVGGGSPTDLLSVSVEARLFFRPKAIPTESSEPPPKSDEREERERRR